MDIIRCIQKIYPDWKGGVWGNKYEGIKPDESETRPVPTLKELEAVWTTVQAEIEKGKAIPDTKAALEEIDFKSIRSIREWLAAQATAPQWINDYEAQAVAERAKLR